MLKENAYAKINLFLDISSKREDGFHDIISYMQTVSLADTLTLDANAFGGVRVKGNYDVDERSDLVYMAAELFLTEYRIGFGVDIEVNKRIPMQGGLAGGSADAAATLRGLNRLFKLDRPLSELAELSAKLGSDVPFCVVGGGKLTYGRGEILKDAPKLPDCGIVIVKGKTGCSTPAQFKALDERYNDFVGYAPKTDKLDAMLSAIENNDIKKLGENLYNIFEKAPGYDRAPLNIMKENGAFGALLSGSGSSVFGVFENIKAAKNAAEAIERNGFTAYACEPRN